jgi:hypothetical protein
VLKIPAEALIAASERHPVIVKEMADKGALGSIEVAGAEQPGIFRTLKPGMGGTGGH